MNVVGWIGGHFVILQSKNNTFYSVSGLTVLNYPTWLQLTWLPIHFNKINSRWQVDKEALWLFESPTYLSKCTPPFLGICRLYF